MNKVLKRVIASILFLLFLIMAFSINKSFIEKVDTLVYNYISNSITDSNTIIFKGITFLGSTTFIIFVALILAIVWYKDNKGRGVVFSLIVSTILNCGVKWLIKRPRPNINQLVTETGFSFPSGHTMATTTLVGVLMCYLWESNWSKTKKIIFSIILGIIPILVMISRIYLGVHYFSDVFAGFLLSISLVLFLSSFRKNLIKKINFLNN